MIPNSVSRPARPLISAAKAWLLIDEAGQATPQNAVGALWRTKRVVAFGDPLQLEPVNTLPFRAEQVLRKEIGVDEK